MARLAHLSDIHLTVPDLGWRGADWFNKRLAAWMNYRWLGRGRRFRQADLVMDRLLADLDERGGRHLVFSGDATALGFDAEMARAAAALQVDRRSGLAVPGNHDYCTVPAAASGNFERRFAPWQEGQRVDGEVYPFAQQVEEVWLIALNSCTGNRWAWDAGGSVDAAQLQRLERLLAELPPGPRILVTHYPILLVSGKRERSYRGLRNLDLVLEVAQRGGVGLWLHGHRHGAYRFQEHPYGRIPVICAGSATQTNLWSYGEYYIEGDVLRGNRRGYDPAAGRFVEIESFTMKLGGSSEPVV